MEVTKNVPIPKRGKFDFGRLRESGDSICITGLKTQKEILRARSAAYSYGRYYGFEVVTRVEGDGIRVWRI